MVEACFGVLHWLGPGHSVVGVGLMVDMVHAVVHVHLWVEVLHRRVLVCKFNYYNTDSRAKSN